jgi:hypothetical protein
MKKWMVLLGVVAVLGGLRACLHQAPDERIGEFSEAICAVAKRGKKAPLDGVNRLFALMARRGPDLLHDWGELLVEIEKIDDSRKHDDRARLAHDRIMAPLGACMDDLDEFLTAVEQDHEASERLENGVERLLGTLEIIFDGRLVKSLRNHLKLRRF